MFDQEYQTQYKIFKGEYAMGNGNFSIEQVKLATLMQMKKDGVYQNAINLVQTEGPKTSAGDVIEVGFCVPNCVKKHKHNFTYDYSKSFKDPLEERPGECFDLDPAVFMVKGTPINLESRLPYL